MAFKEKRKFAVPHRWSSLELSEDHRGCYFRLGASVEIDKRVIVSSGTYPYIARGRELVDDMLKQIHTNWVHTGEARASIDFNSTEVSEGAASYTMAVLRSMGLDSFIVNDERDKKLVAYARPSASENVCRRDVACGSDEPLPAVEASGEARAAKRARSD